MILRHGPRKVATLSNCRELIILIHTLLVTKMPKAVSSTFRPATIANPKKKGESSSSSKGDGNGNGNAASTGSAGSGGRNHLFNTERFGQHILTNPAVAQG